ncbi:MAG: hypothetical protein IT478_06085 [Xanthomonadales bacterium]|nr:hypothetical protein [Xanthomonadales bacterium]
MKGGEKWPCTAPLRRPATPKSNARTSESVPKQVRQRERGEECDELPVTRHHGLEELIDAAGKQDGIGLQGAVVRDDARGGVFSTAQDHDPPIIGNAGVKAVTDARQEADPLGAAPGDISDENVRPVVRVRGDQIAGRRAERDDLTIVGYRRVITCRIGLRRIRTKADSLHLGRRRAREQQGPDADQRGTGPSHESMMCHAASSVRALKKHA